MPAYFDPDELLGAVARLCVQAHGEAAAHAQHMVALLVDGLRYGARSSVNTLS